MVETYGLTKGAPPPSVEDVNAMLDANTSKLMDVSSALVNGTNKIIEANGAKLDGVVKRLVNSVNGHLRKNTGVLKPIGNALVEHVDNYLAGNHAMLSAAAADPAIADYLRTAPAPSGYTIQTPTAPAPLAGGAATGPAQVSLDFTIYFNQRTRGIVAVPTFEITPALEAGWTAQGWQKVMHQTGTHDELTALLQGSLAALLNKDYPPIN